MPIPKPRKGEKQKDYISRAIKFIMSEDPKTPQKQAIAIAYSTWRTSKGIKKKGDIKSKKSSL